MRRHIKNYQPNNNLEQFESQYKIPCISNAKMKSKFEQSYAHEFLENELDSSKQELIKSGLRQLSVINNEECSNVYMDGRQGSIKSSLEEKDKGGDS